MPEEKKSNFSKNEKLIIKVIHDERAPMAIRDIATKTGLSWITVRKYLEILVKKGWVIEEEEMYKEIKNA